MHRFDLDNVKFVQDMHAKGVVCLYFIGRESPDRATVDTLAATGLTPEYITIDIAHGHADSVRDMIAYTQEPNCRRASSSLATWPRPKP
jgi:GMP reductase